MSPRQTVSRLPRFLAVRVLVRGLRRAGGTRQRLISSTPRLAMHLGFSCGRHVSTLARVGVAARKKAHLAKPTAKVVLTGDGCCRPRLGRPRGGGGGGVTGDGRRPLRQDGRLLDRLRDDLPNVRSPEVQGHGVVPAGPLQLARGPVEGAVPLAVSCRSPAGPCASLFVFQVGIVFARKTEAQIKSAPRSDFEGESGEGGTFFSRVEGV